MCRANGRRRRQLWRATLLGWLLVSVCACREVPRPSVVVNGNTLTVENQTAEEWLNVEVWLNDHYRVTKSSMVPGERFAIPLDAFVAGFGQRFNSKRQVVQGVEVTATTARGEPVSVIHGHGRRR